MSTPEIKANNRAKLAIPTQRTVSVRNWAKPSLGDRAKSALDASWAWIAKNLLVLFIVFHHVALIGGWLSILEAAYLLTKEFAQGSWSVAHLGEAACFGWLGWLLTMRLWTALPGLVTASYDAADEDVEGSRLDRENHPKLFRIVEEVAARVGAPAPNEIWIAADARCFAFEQRDFGVMTQRVLVLVLGLPHLLVMSSSELQVIVGHELAHVRQKDTTFAVFFYRFTQSLRTYLIDAKKAPLGWVNPVVWFEWISLRIFQLLIGPVQRRQEIRADCRSAQVFGGDMARRTLLKDWMVTSQFAALMERRVEESRNGIPHGARSIHQEFAEEWREVSPSGREYLRQRLGEEEQESYWDSHPALISRLRAVAAYPNFGIHDNEPALSLLGDSQVLFKCLSDELATSLELSAQPLAAVG